MDPHSSDFYERLGLPKGADLSDVRRAYAKAVRRYTPEHAPEEFKRVREAYDTLKDPAARRTYDATSDPHVKALVETGNKALEAELYDDATAAFKRALVLSPKAIFIRNLLGLSRMYAGDFEAAREQFDRLTAEDPDNPAVWQNLGSAARNLEDWTTAERAFQQAIALDPEDADARVGLAWTLFGQDDYQGAVTFLEESILHDGVVDFDDLSYFLGLIDLHLRNGNHEAIKETAQRLQGILYEGWQRERVAHHFAQTAAMLTEVGALDLAHTLARESLTLRPDDRMIRNLVRSVETDKARFDEFEVVQDDEKLRPTLRNALGVLMAVRFGQWDSVEEQKSRLTDVIGVLLEQCSLVYIRGHTSRRLKDELKYLKQQYPNLHMLVPEGVRREAGAIVATAALIECDVCKKAARAPLVSGQFGCPECGKPFQLNAQNRSVTAVKEQLVENWGCWIWVILVLAYALLSGL